MLKKLFTRVHFYSWHVPHKIPIFFFLQLNALPQYSLLFWYFPLNELHCFCVQHRSDAGAHLNAKLLATRSYGIIEFPFPITKPCPCHLPFWVSDLEVSWHQCLMRFSKKKMQCGYRPLCHVKCHDLWLCGCTESDLLMWGMKWP